MSWTRKVNHPGEMVRKGDVIDVKILDVDVEKRRISLGIKQLSEDPWGDLAVQFAVGTELQCTVARLLDRGMVVNLTEEVEGFVPLNQLGVHVEHPSNVYKTGDEISAEVVEFDLEGRKIVLSVAEFFKDKEEAWGEYCSRYPAPEKPEKKKAGREEAEPAAEQEDAPTDVAAGQAEEGPAEGAAEEGDDTDAAPAAEADEGDSPESDGK
jgi:small subunit ribosomal protein S1